MLSVIGCLYHVALSEAKRSAAGMFVFASRQCIDASWMQCMQGSAVVLRSAQRHLAVIHDTTSAALFREMLAEV
jgi:hypothetical protein